MELCDGYRTEDKCWRFCISDQLRSLRRLGSPASWCIKSQEHPPDVTSTMSPARRRPFLLHVASPLGALLQLCHPFPPFHKRLRFRPALLLPVALRPCLALPSRSPAREQPGRALLSPCPWLRCPPTPALVASPVPPSLLSWHPGRDICGSRGYTPAPTHWSQPILKRAHAEQPHSVRAAASPLPAGADAGGGRRAPEQRGMCLWSE